MDSGEELFEILGLPVKPIDPDRLNHAYTTERTKWFLRQYMPEHHSEAVDRVARLDEAYRTLRNEKSQLGVLKAILARRVADRPTGDELPDPSEIPMPRPAPRDPLPKPATPLPDLGLAPGEQQDRARILRKVLMTAEMMTSGGQAEISADDEKQLVTLAERLGLEPVDATRVVALMLLRIRKGKPRPAPG